MNVCVKILLIFVLPQLYLSTHITTALSNRVTIYQMWQKGYLNVGNYYLSGTNNEMSGKAKQAVYKKF